MLLIATDFNTCSQVRHFWHWLIEVEDAFFEHVCWALNTDLCHEPRHVFCFCVILAAIQNKRLSHKWHNTSVD